MSVRAALLATALITLTAAPAQAENRSWTAVRKRIPADAYAVFSVDVLELQKTALGKQLWATAKAWGPDSTAEADRTRAACGSGLEDMFSDVTIVLAPDHNLLVLGMRTMTKDRWLVCMRNFNDGKAEITATDKGGITEYGMGAGGKVWGAWLTPTVVAVSTGFKERASLVRLIGGKGPGAPLVATVKSAGAGKAGWAAWTQSTPIGSGSAKGTLKRAHARIDAAGADTSIRITLTMATAAEARGFAGDLRTDLSQLLSAVLPELVHLATDATIQAKGDQVLLAFTITEKDANTFAARSLEILAKKRGGP